MSIGKTVWSVKCGVIGMLLVMGMTSVAEPTVTVGEVTTGEPWSKVTVNYTLNGTDAEAYYKVAFDVTAGGQTAGVTNGAAKLMDGAATKELDTAALFGKQVTDTKAKVKVSLIAIKPKAAGVQLWAGGPFWAEANLGQAEQGGPAEYGALYTFDNATKEVAKLGGDWRLPSQNEFEALCSNCDQKWDAQNGVMGRLFTGKGDYKSNSIFLPAAGYGRGYGREYAGDKGNYWSSTEDGANYARYLYFYAGGARVSDSDRILGFSVRAVRGSAE